MPQRNGGPTALVATTVKAALLVATGQGLAAGVVSTHVLSLMEGVVKIMFLTKVKIAAAVLIVAGVVGAGVAVSAYHALAADQPAMSQIDDPKNSSQDEPPAEARAAKKQKEGKQSASPPRKVQVMRPISRQVVDRRDYSGRVEANQVEVFAQASGALLNVMFQAGAEVQRGNQLFAIDPRPYLIEREKAQAEWKRAEARLNYARAQLTRAKKLNAKDHPAITQEDFDKAVADHEEAEAAVQAAKAGLELAALQLDSTTIRAPISGHIGRPRVTPGTYVKAGTTLLTTIVATEPLYAEFDIDAATFLALQRQVGEGKLKLQGATVRWGLFGEGNFPYRGTIDFVGNQIRPNGSLPIRAVIAKPHPLLVPGLYMGVRLAVSEPHTGLFVPNDAIRANRRGEIPCVHRERSQCRGTPLRHAGAHGGWLAADQRGPAGGGLDHRQRLEKPANRDGRRARTGFRAEAAEGIGFVASRCLPLTDRTLLTPKGVGLHPALFRWFPAPSWSSAKHPEGLVLDSGCRGTGG